MYNNKNHLIRLQERSRDLDSRASCPDLNRASCTGLKFRLSPLRPLLERTFLRGAVTLNSSPPLNMPRLPQRSESQPFPLPIVPCPDIPVGGRLAHFVEQWGELKHNKWVLSFIRDGFRIPFRSTPLLLSVPISLESIFLPVITRRNSGTSPEMGSGKVTSPGTPIFFHSRLFLVPKKNGKLLPVIDLSLLKKVREKSRECHNHKPQPFPDPKRKRTPTNLNKHKPNKRTKSTKISSLFPKRGNRNTKRTEKHKNTMTHGKTYNKSPCRINHKATKS